MGFFRSRFSPPNFDERSTSFDPPRVVVAPTLFLGNVGAVPDLDAQIRDSSSRLAAIEQEAAVNGIALSTMAGAVRSIDIRLNRPTDAENARRLYAEGLNERYRAEAAVRDRLKQEKGGYFFR